MQHSDLDYALSLHYILNGEMVTDQAAATQEIEKNTESEEKEEEFNEVIPVKFVKSKDDEFYLTELKTWISLENDVDWIEIKMNQSINIQFIFEKMKDHYFGQMLKDTEYNVSWDLYGIIKGDKNYDIIDTFPHEIIVATSAFLRPRIQFVSLLFHILIHIYLKKVSSSIRFDQHTPEFRAIMSFFNEKIETNISTSHTFLFNENEIKYPNEWWQCTGICCQFQPFHGVIRSTSVPSEIMSFWSSHHNKCGGSFFKIFEGKREKSDGNIEKKFFRNIKYMNPKTKYDKGSKLKATKKIPSLPVRAHIDLTEEENMEKNMCDVINLDESEYVDKNEVQEYKHASKIITHCKDLMKICFLCKRLVGELRIQSHLDSCTGFQQEVEFVFKP